MIKLSQQISELQQKVAHLQANKADKSEFEGLIKRFIEIESKFEGIQSMLILKGADIKVEPRPTNDFDSEVVKSLVSKLDLMWRKIAELDKEIIDLKKLLSNSNNNNGRNTVNYSEGGGSQADIDILKEQMVQVRKDLEAIRALIQKNQKETEKQLKFKADLNRLNELEKILMDQLNEQMNLLNNKIDDLRKMKQQIAKLEANLKKLQDFVMDQLANMTHGMAGQEGEEEAMFAKRPLQGWSCASCDKDIVNLQGRIADYQPWMKMPMRDPTERISRVG